MDTPTQVRQYPKSILSLGEYAIDIIDLSRNITQMFNHSILQKRLLS